MAARPTRTNPKRLYISVLAPTLVVACLVAALATVSVKVLGSIRGYATGESAWSKSCADAELHLSHYALSRDPADYDEFQRALQAPLGSRQAREELTRPHPDTALITRLFIAGGSHPDDIPGMIALFRYFGAMPVFKQTMAAWIEGDALIDRLRALGDRLHEQILHGASNETVQLSLIQLRQLADDFHVAEQLFRVNVDNAGRLTEALLIGTILLTTAGLTVAGLLLVRSSLIKQVRHERSLAKATRRWELAAEAAGLGLFEQKIDSDQISLDANACTMYGLGQQACMVTPDELDQCIDEADRLQASAIRSRAVETGQTVRGTHRVNRADGQQRQIELIGRQEVNEHKGDVRLIGVVRDVTDEVRQAQLTMQRDAAEKVAAAQREFLSRLSHELRTPLNAILGFAQLLKMEHTEPLPAHQRQQVEMILAAGQQLLALVEDVLDLTKVEAGEISMVLQPVNATQVMHASMSMIDSARQLLGVSFVDKLPLQAIWVRADPQRLQQVFMNLLSNSCKYNRPGGHVTVSAHQDGHRVVFDILDEGLGMSEDETQQLFQPFKRIHAHIHAMEGTGLGLYIVKMLVERMNGTVVVRSQKGVGSTFSVTLPTAAPSSPSETAS